MQDSSKKVSWTVILKVKIFKVWILCFSLQYKKCVVRVGVKHVPIVQTLMELEEN